MVSHGKKYKCYTIDVREDTRQRVNSHENGFTKSGGEPILPRGNARSHFY